MTLEEAIEQVERTYKENHSGWLYALKRGETKYAERCKKSMDEFEQLAEWLRELQERRKQSEIVRCKGCKYNVSSHKCLHPESFFLVPDDDFYCGYAERRTDE